MSATSTGEGRRLGALLIAALFGLTGSVIGYGVSSSILASGAIALCACAGALGLLGRGVLPVLSSGIIGAVVLTMVALGVDASATAGVAVIGGICGSMVGLLPMPLRVTLASGALALASAGTIPGVSGAGELAALVWGLAFAAITTTTLMRRDNANPDRRDGVE